MLYYATYTTQTGLSQKGVIELPQRRTAIKDLRKNWKNRLHNLDIKTDLKKTIKNFLALVENKKKTEAQDQLKLVFKKLDKAAKRNVMHSKTAARRKSKFSRLVLALK